LEQLGKFAAYCWGGGGKGILKIVFYRDQGDNKSMFVNGGKVQQRGVVKIHNTSTKRVGPKPK